MDLARWHSSSFLQSVVLKLGSKTAMERTLNGRESKMQNNEILQDEQITGEDGKEITAKSVVSNYIQSTTIHGLSSIYSASNIYMRLFWFLVFLSVFGLLAWQIHAVFTQFTLKTVVTTQENTAYQSMIFPAITFCSTRQFKGSWNSYFLAKNNSTKLRTHGLTMKDFFVDERLCSFGVLKCNFTSDFKISTSLEHGNCFTMKVSSNRTQRNLGQKHSFQLLLNLKQHIYWSQGPASRKRPLLEDYTPASILVMIHDENEHIEFFTDTNAIMISPGNMASIKIKKQRIVRLPSPYPDKCVTDANAEQITGIPLPKVGKYSVNVCKFMSMVRKKMKQCKAVSLEDGDKLRQLFPNKAFNYRIFETYDEYDCINYNFSMPNKTTSECPLPCEEQRYKPTVSTASWPSKTDLPNLCSQLETFGVDTKTCSKEFIKDNFIRLQVYFEDFTVETIKQIPAYGRSQVISDLGGSMGLWIGASIYSLFELGSTFISLASLYILRIQKARKQRQVQVASSIS